MSLGKLSNDRYREMTNQIVPAVVSKRMTCAACSRHQSIGQFEVGEDVCATCKPKPAGWRRGGINKVQLKDEL